MPFDCCSSFYTSPNTYMIGVIVSRRGEGDPPDGPVPPFPPFPPFSRREEGFTCCSCSTITICTIFTIFAGEGGLCQLELFRHFPKAKWIGEGGREIRQLELLHHFHNFHGGRGGIPSAGAFAPFPPFSQRGMANSAICSCSFF